MAQSLHLTASAASSTAALQLQGVGVAYGSTPVLRALSLDIPRGSFTVIVGSNGCGKSTLLRVLSGAMRPGHGQVLLDGADLASLRRKAVARQMAYLPQNPVAPELITVHDLVARGRYPHQSLLRQWSDEDAAAVARALRMTDIAALADRPVHALSGGQRQRAWLALVLAQDTDILLLDEPTTFLDIRHQIELLDLCRALHRQGKTVVAVLHDLNLAFRYAQQVVLMRSGGIAAQGAPHDVVTREIISQVFEIDCHIIADPQTATPMVVPLAPSSHQHHVA